MKHPRLLHPGMLHKIFIDTLIHPNLRVSNSAVCLNDCSIRIVDKEIEEMTREKIGREDVVCESGRNIEVSAGTIKFGSKLPNIELMSAEADRGYKFGSKLPNIELMSAEADRGYKFGSKLPNIDWYVR